MTVSERDAKAAETILWARTYRPDLGRVRLVGDGPFIVLPEREDDDDLAADDAVAERRRLEAKEREHVVRDFPTNPRIEGELNDE